MIKLQSEYDAYTTLGLNYYNYQKNISGLCVDPKSKPQYFIINKMSSKLDKKTYVFHVLKDKFIISDTINKNILNGIKNINLSFPYFAQDINNKNMRNLSIIGGKTCINSLLEFENIRGTNFTKGDSTYNNLFKEEIPSPTETYYWDDGRNSREGIRIKNPNNYQITDIYVYGSYNYPLYECYLEQMNDDGSGSYIKRLGYQYGVGNEGNASYKPMYYHFNEIYNAKVTDFVRYSVYDSALTRILVFGNPYVRKILLEKDGAYYTITDEKYDNITKSYTPLNINELNEEIFNQYSFNINDLLLQKNINDETFIPLEKFNNFKFVVLTETDIEIQKINEIKLNILGNDVPSLIRKKEEPTIPTDISQLLQDTSYSIQSDSFRCVVLSNKKRKFVLQPDVRTHITIKTIGKTEEEDDGKLKGDIKGFTFICQKGHFVELNLDFVEENVKIDFVSNLPDGLVFENGKIKGTPLKSGKTKVEMHTSKKQILHCNIEVPPLIRLL